MKTKNVYSIPLPKNAIFLSISDPRAHYSYWKHAIDLMVDFKIPILASLDGEVVAAKDNSKKGGDDLKYADDKYNNYDHYILNSQQYSDTKIWNEWCSYKFLVKHNNNINFENY